MSYNLLSQSAFWIINKDLAKLVGLNAALLLSDLITKMEYFEKQGKTDEEGFFFNTSENIERDTFLTPYLQRKSISILKKKGFIETKLIGIPAKQGFKIIKNKLSKFLITRSKENTKLINNNKYNNNKKIKKKEAKASPKGVSANKKITFSMFDNFWKIYPRKVNKGNAKKAWEKLCNKEGKDKPTWKEVRKAIHEQCKTKQWQDEKYIKHPATWLNSYSWLNDVSEMNKDFPILIHATNIDKPFSEVPENPYNDPTLTMEEKKKIFFADVKEYTENWKKRGEKPQICGVNASLPHSWEEEAFVIWERENAAYLKWKENEYSENKEL